MQPSWAHEPKATSTFDLRRRRWARCSFSLVRIDPLNRQTSMWPSGMASTSLYLKSTATGQKRMSATASMSRIFSRSSTMAISQPPQDAAQYRPSFSLSAMLFLLARQLLLPVERSQLAHLSGEIAHQLRPLDRLGARDPAPVEAAGLDA